MAKITFITTDGNEHVLEGSSGSLMELATDNNIHGIDGDCGGVCSCATCHVHVQADHWDKVGPPNQIEADMLEFDDKVTEYSRLACQIDLSQEIDGLVIHVAND